MRNTNSSDDETSSTSTNTIINNLNFECGVCKDEYNNLNRQIQVLHPCGHSFCKRCVDKLSMCPICRKLFSHVSTNWIIQGLIEENEENSVKNIFNDIHPFYMILIKYKKKIEEAYIKYDCDRDYLSADQSRLIKEIIINLKGINLDSDIVEKSMIPKWLKTNILKNLEKINNYNNTMNSELLELLPFCL